MYDNYNYPPGADGPDAPWNEVPVPEKEFEITVSQTLVKTCDVVTDKYIPGGSWVEYEHDEEGGHAIGCHEPDDTSDVDWEKEFSENDHYTPLELINKFKKYLEKEWDVLKYAEEANDAETRRRKREVKHLIEECEGWEAGDTDFEEA